MKWARPVPASQEILEKIEEKHGIGFHEIEDMFRRRHVVLRGTTDQYGELRYTSLGETAAGRHLLVVYTKPEPRVAKVITARVMTEREKPKSRKAVLQGSAGREEAKMTTTGTIKPRKGRRAVPRFRSVEAESAFWDTHSFLDFGDWEVISYKEALRDLSSRKEPKLPVTLRLERGLIRKLKQVARRHGVKYQSLVREILRRSLSSYRA